MAWEKRVSQKDGMVPFLVYTAGELDVEASDRKFHEAVFTLKAKTGATDDVVLGAINSMFDQYRGSSLNVAALASGAIQKMGSSNQLFKNPALFGMLSKRVSEVLDSNTEPKVRVSEDTKAYLFGVRKGPQGGHYRIADQAK